MIRNVRWSRKSWNGYLKLHVWLLRPATHNLGGLWSSQTRNWLKKPGKLLLGFPNYAYDWTLPYEAGLTRAVVIGNEAARQLAFDTRSEIQFDETAQTPWFSYTGMDGAVHEVWFEDVRSSLARFHLVKQYALRGLGYWNFMRPFTANFSLANAALRLPD